MIQTTLTTWLNPTDDGQLVTGRNSMLSVCCLGKPKHRLKGMTMYKLSNGNKKTGPMLTVMSSRETCPNSCPLKNNGCYAENFPMVSHWNKMQNAIDINQLFHAIKMQPKGSLWRFNTAGDLPGNNESIDLESLDTIVRANKSRRGFTYTHKYNHCDNIEAIESANREGFTINLSANNVNEADSLSELTNCPVVCVLPANATEKHYKTPAGRDIVTCPASIRDDATCASCGICADAKRSFIVGFPAHGTRKKKADLIACENI